MVADLDIEMEAQKQKPGSRRKIIISSPEQMERF
jgi:hypothetical protein